MQRIVSGPAVRQPRALVFGVALGLMALAGCGDDDASAQDEYCAAGESLESSVAALIDIDLIAGGTDSLNAAVETVQEDVAKLGDSAGEAVADETDALGQSIDNLEGALADFIDDVSTESTSALATAIQDVGSSAQAVYGTLTDCP